MRNIGGTLFFFGIGSMVLHLANYEFVILMWIDMWGPNAGWIIRILMAVVGGALWLMGRAQENQQQ